MLGTVLVAVASAASAAGPEPTECAFLESRAWPETRAPDPASQFKPPFRVFMGIRTGMGAHAACRAMVKRGFQVTNHVRLRRPLGSPPQDMSFVREIRFEKIVRPIGVSYDSLAKVTLFIGDPATGYQVEAIEVEYFFADQETPEPENDSIRRAFIKKFGRPTSANFAGGAPSAFWVIARGGLSKQPHDKACDTSHLQHPSPGSILERPADKSCLAVLTLSYGGNMNEEITTSRYLRYRFLDNARARRNRIVEYEMTEMYRKKPL